MNKNIIRIIIFICFCHISIFAQSKGGHWQFENNGFDTADWDMIENNGTLQNQATYASIPPLIGGSAYLWLDSSNVYDYFLINDSDDLDFTDEDLAISLWVYPILLNDVHYLINKGRQDSNPKTTNYALRIAKDTWNLEFLIRDANNQAQLVASSFTIPENQWTFLAIFYDFSESKVYMWNDANSPAVDTLNFAKNFFANSDPLSIGSWYRNDPVQPSSKDFEGRLDDVRISGRLLDVLPDITAIHPPDFHEDDFLLGRLEIFPNPSSLSRNQTSIKMYLDKPSQNRISLLIYNILGQEVFKKNITDPINGKIFNWSFYTNGGKRIPAGIYFVRMRGENLDIVKKLMILY
ncbi:MAG: T9SS type A sorting domain-containing protein [Calditrichaeota bacterium]|nr:T9SS type A sorting domain-containing protein [Calditrichota bacterium]